MKKILFRIDNNNLIVKEKIKLSTDYKNIMNTNIINLNELVFSDEYIISNSKIVEPFINELCINYNVDTLILENYSLTPIVLRLLKNNKSITSLIIKEDVPLTFNICELLTKTNIKNLSCYNIQPFMIEYLDINNILVESRNEILFFSKFMLQNNLDSFSSIFYKVSIQVEDFEDEQDEQDFLAFCKINKYLKTINLSTVKKSDIEYIIDCLKKNNKKNIKIVIRNNITDEKTIAYLKRFNKKRIKDNIYFKLQYTNDYIEENIVKQANSNLLKSCGFIIIIIIAFTFGYVFYDNYISMKNVNDMQEKIIDVIKNTSADKANEKLKEINEKINEDDKKATNEMIASLFDINPEIVAWLKVNGTNIDYPVVQTANNTYYLKHNFYLNKDNNGWVFMDYRNDIQNLNDNIIIYAHNRYYSGIMFGTLQNTLKKSWYSDENNLVITLDTLYDKLKFKVFSIYKIETTSDYLQIGFTNKKEKLKFLNTLKDRSNHNFKVDLNENDKILTLSTCADEDSRYVLHAVLINEDK